MYILAQNTWYSILIRQLFWHIDNIIYKVIPQIYELLESIARVSIFSQADILKMTSRIYSLLIVFMVFKVTFSLIMYVVNPDDFSDKSKGVSKLATNIVISLSLLILTPYIFNLAYTFQSIILEDNTLATLIFAKEEESTDFFKQGGSNIAFITMVPFFAPDASECNILIGSDGAIRPNCQEYLMSKKNDAGFPQTTYANYVTGVNEQNFGAFFRLNMATATDEDGTFIIDYKFLLSTTVGVIIVLLLVTFCMDVGLRSIKLAFLQLIAPIPIISYVDPKSGKDGLFKKWYTMCFQTYLGLFVRLLSLYLAVYIMGQVADFRMVDIIEGSTVTSGFVSIFIIIGCLMFVKQFPKMLEGLGVKMGGGFTLNPLKKFENEALGGKKLLGLGAAGAAVGLAGGVNTLSRMGQGLFNKNNWKNKDGNVTAGSILGNLGKTIGRSATSGIAGMSSAAFRGVSKTMKGKKPGEIFSDSYQEAMFSKLKREDRNRKAGAVTFKDKAKLAGESVMADFMRFTGNLNRGQQEYLDAANQDAFIQSMQNDISSYKVAQTKLRNEKFKPFEDAQSIGKNIDALLENEKDVKIAKSSWQNAISRGASDEEIESLRQNYKLVKGQVLKAKYEDKDSHIHRQVELYNDEVSNMTKDMTIEQKEAFGFKEINTEITYKESSNGNFVQVGDNHYEIKRDEAGVEYYESDQGRVYADDWAKDSVRCKVDTTGVSIMGDNDDMVTAEKISFETSDEYVNLENNIKTREQKIEEFKSSEEYKIAHDENTYAKIGNTQRFNDKKQDPGYKPSSKPMDSQLTDVSYMSNLDISDNSESPRPHRPRGRK